MLDNGLDLPTEEGARGAGSIAGQPDHLTLGTTLFVKINLGPEQPFCGTVWVKEKQNTTPSRLVYICES